MARTCRSCSSPVPGALPFRAFTCLYGRARAADFAITCMCLIGTLHDAAAALARRSRWSSARGLFLCRGLFRCAHQDICTKMLSDCLVECSVFILWAVAWTGFQYHQLCTLIIIRKMCNGDAFSDHAGANAGVPTSWSTMLAQRMLRRLWLRRLKAWVSRPWLSRSVHQ